MKHTMLTFRLHRKGVALVAFGSVLLGGLLFGAGWLTGQRRAAKVPSVPSVPSVPLVSSAPKEKQQSEPKDHLQGEAFALEPADLPEGLVFPNLTGRGERQRRR